MNNRPEVVIVINPGSTSTKFALWSREESVAEEVVRHEQSKLAPRAVDQFDQRREVVEQALERHLEGVKVVGAVGRGGLLGPIEGGTYRVTQRMLDFLAQPSTANHASNLGAHLAYYFAGKFGVEAYVVDPVTVDEFVDVARLTGVTWCDRLSRAHTLNIKYCVHRAAAEIGKSVDQTRFVVVHLGGGTSVAAVKDGRIIDSNNALHGMGPYSPERAGALPIGPLVERCFSEGVNKKELLDELARKSGLMAYCGTSDVRDVLNRAEAGDETADLALRGMVYQTAKEIGAMATSLEGWIDAVIITGGVAHSDEIIAMLRSYIEYLGEIVIYPGEGELEALAAGAFRVIDRLENAKVFV